MNKFINCVLVVLFFVLFATPINAESIGKFKKIGTLTQYLKLLPWQIQVVDLPDGRIVFYDEENIEIYDPKTNKIGGISQPKYKHDYTKITALDDGRLFIPGTKQKVNYSNIKELDVPENSEYSEIYNPSTNTWTQAARMNYPRRDFGLVKLKDGRLFIYGGQTPNRDFLLHYPNTEAVYVKYTDALYAEIYDPNTNKYTVVAKTPKIEKKITKYVSMADCIYMPYEKYQKNIELEEQQLKEFQIREAQDSKYKTVKKIIRQGKNGNIINFNEEKKIIPKRSFPPITKLKPLETPEYFGGTSDIELLPNGEVIAYYPDKDYAEIFNPETNEFRVIPYKYELKENNDIVDTDLDLVAMLDKDLKDNQILYSVIPYEKLFDDYSLFKIYVSDRNLYLYNPKTKKLRKAGKYPRKYYPRVCIYRGNGKILILSYSEYLFLYQVKKKYLK